MNRRAFLAGGFAFLTAVTSGCSQADDSPGVILTHVELGNASGVAQEFDVLVQHDGEIVHWSTHEVGTGETEGEAGGAVIDIDSPDEWGNVEVSVRVDGVWSSTQFEDEKFTNSYVIAVVTYGKIEDDMLRISRIRSDRASPSSGG